MSLIKIKWLIESREVPIIGMIETGEVKDVPSSLGKQLIKQKAATEVKAETAEKRKGDK